MEPVAAVRLLGGAARRAELLRQGASRRAIDAAVRSGRLERPFTGVLALPSARETGVRAAYFDARITCQSAAEAHGLRMLSTPRQIHLEIPAERGGTTSQVPARRGVCLHRTRTFEAGERLVPIPRALDVMGRCADPLAQLVTLDHALARREIRIEDISRFQVTSLRRRRWLEYHADPQAGSVPETCARVAMRRAGLNVVSQAPIGDWRHADFLVDGCLFVEIDGMAYHGERRQFDEDRHRDRTIVAMGKHVIRFTYGDAVHAPDRLVDDVRAALRAIKRR